MTKAHPCFCTKSFEKHIKHNTVLGTLSFQTHWSTVALHIEKNTVFCTMSCQTHLNAIAFYTKSFETKKPRTKDRFMYDAVSKSLECHCLVCNQEIICVAVYQIKQCVGKRARRVAVVHWCVLRTREFDRLAFGQYLH